MSAATHAAAASVKELVALIERGDWHEVMLRVNREVLRRYYPDARYAVLVAGMPDGVPDVTLPVIPLSAAASSPPPAPAPSSSGRFGL